MKKTLLIVLSLLISTYTFCQSQFSFNRQAEVEVQNSKDKLYENARKWKSKTFTDDKFFIDYRQNFEDKEQGKLIFDEFSDILISIVSKASFTISIIVKDNKYSYEIRSVGINFRENPNYFEEAEIFINNTIALARTEIDSLKALRTHRKQKKELQKIEKEIAYYKSVIEDFNNVKVKIMSNLDTIVASLKTAMKSNDDF
ncbi:MULTISPECIES: DUF4468 domain-containing protein [unclassified Arcicella]|uniref:DUF4468 domain-containing protein n=1 Tax=unclassified Arcicella TaxID=2644986 RepID=UPI00285D8AE1|nr:MULTISPECIES: DUF4468 domain-containing protein [unclassified Arcicella]MDR6564680.1 hypothetical protein [Arcicella sp. BE51]MDR6814393.1 hypothetical protein [Arcicella sp. BE140]MDR6825853.1 hypothetical protein [Arcicella sp. BE139]